MEDPTADIFHRRLQAVEEKLARTNAAPTIPTYDSTNFPQDAVYGQIVKDINDHTGWVYGEDNAWHQLGGTSGASVTPAAIYGGELGGTGYILLPLGGSSTFIGFNGLSTNDLATFKLKGSSSPYKGKILSGYYHWEIEVDFQQYTIVVSAGTDPTNGADYGIFTVNPVWGARFQSPHADINFIYPDATEHFVVGRQNREGYMNLGGDISDLEVSIGLRDVQNTGTAVTGCTLNLVRVSNFLPDASTNIVP